MTEMTSSPLNGTPVRRLLSTMYVLWKGFKIYRQEAIKLNLLLVLHTELKTTTFLINVSRYFSLLNNYYYNSVSIVSIEKDIS